MYDELIADVKMVLAWVWNWVTVLTGMVVGFLAYGFDAFNAIIGTADITPLLPQASALKIITAVAILKGVVAYYQSRKAA